MPEDNISFNRINNENKKLKQQLTNSRRQIEFMQSSKFWELRNFYIKIKNFILHPVIAYRGLSLKLSELKYHWDREGGGRTMKRVYNFLFHGKGVVDINQINTRTSDTDKKLFYDYWIKKNENYNINKVKTEIQKFERKPMISIITPVYNVEAKWLQKCINSVTGQYYGNWELCLYDDCSTNTETLTLLNNLVNKNSKIKIQFGKQNLHISLASNQALQMATGEYVCFLDHDDELAPHALFEVVKQINQTPNVDYIYSDEDKLDHEGNRCDPYFKPNWNREFFLANNYTCHLSVYKRDLINQIGGFRQGFEGSQDYDLTLRYLDIANSVQHISKILYHWRKIPQSTAEKLSAKNYADDSGLKALQDYFKKKNAQISVIPAHVPATYRVQRKANPSNMVSIIVPFQDKIGLLKKCIDSIINKTTYPNYEIIGISNNSLCEETAQLMQDYNDKFQNIRFLQYNVPFNFARINNFAAKFAQGNQLLFLNNDTEVINPDWLETLIEQSQRQNIGAVGTKLLYTDDTIQHAGVIIGLGGIAEHSHKFIHNNEYGYFNTPHLHQFVSAVTGACLMIKKSVFDELGGFDEKNLPISYNDVDLCLRAIEKGYKNLYNPYAVLYHHESASRGKKMDLEQKIQLKKESDYMLKRHEKLFLKGDYYYNKNLSLNKSDYSIRDYYHEKN
jgi:GT2 family glycosyltransferase